MVQWKGDIQGGQAGGKAARLDSVESLNVPNFFVIERDEMAKLAGGVRAGELSEQEFPEELGEQIENAYGEIGMSSEVREAPGEARSLVGGQRNGQRVSVRVSGDRRGVFDYRLNVGASSLERAIKEVASSHYRAETGQEHPAIIVQKMVDPGYSGAAITSYLGSYGLVEAVEGLGVPLEKGITAPIFYLLKDGIEERRVPERQLTVSRNNLNGSHEKDTVSPEPPFSREELEKFFQDVKEEELDVKFVYNRGSFYVVDAFPSDNSNPFDSQEPSLTGVRVSNGEIEGEVGREAVFTDETVPPEKYSEALISRKGGYTSRDAQLARHHDRPAVFSFDGRLKEGQHISLAAREVTPEEKEDDVGQKQVPAELQGAATEVVPVDRDGGIYLSPPFHGARYAVSDTDTRAENIPRSGYLTSYGQVFSFDGGGKAVVDARRLEKRGLEPAMEYLDAELKILLVDSPEPGLLRKAIESGFDVIATAGDVSRMEDIVEREERRFMLERLRDLSG